MRPPRRTRPDAAANPAPQGLTDTDAIPVESGYAVPALDKGLDILEALADQADGFSLTELALRLERNRSEIFRMVDCLKRRGYIRTHPATDKMTLSLRLFELAHKTPVTRRLTAEAMPLMKTLAREVGQSCHLAVCNGTEMLVVAMTNSDRPMEFSVREGTRVGLLTSSSGRIFLAFQPQPERLRLLGQLPPATQAKARALAAQLDELARAGFDSAPSDFIRGVTNMSCPIRDIHGHALASLTVPHLEWQGGQAVAPISKSLKALIGAAQEISSRVLAG